MKAIYETYEEITRDLLDTVKRGDLVKCNDWKRPLRVCAATKNYFVMATRAFGKVVYSVCEKKPSEYSCNNFTKGAFRIGRDNYIFGAPNGYEWETEIEALEYLAGFENGDIELSQRAAVDLKKISIKRSAANTQ